MRKNLPASGGNMSSIFGPEDHIGHGAVPTTETHRSQAHAPQQEKPLQWVAHVQLESSPLTATRESPQAVMKTQCNQK